MDYDVIVVGGGPGGATATAFMAEAGLDVLLVEKDTFPRDKVCGDAISGKSVDVLRRLGVVDDIMETGAVDSWGVTFGGPYGDEAAIPFTKELDRPVPPGFVCAREVFDHVLFERAARSQADVWEDTSVTGLLRGEDDERITGVTLKGGDARKPEREAVTAPLVVGADGAYSVVARELGFDQLDEDHYCAGLRSYWKGVTGFHDNNYVELHFIEDALPGYFWIFPMPGGRANVGIGMLSSAVKENNVYLKKLLQECIQRPRFRERFSGAEQIGSTRGWGLPLGSKPRPMAGAGWLLVGDAASLIDPFTGEGIGNAMIGGELAAQWAQKANAKEDFTADLLAGFEEEVTAYLQDELRLSYWMQRLVNWKRLLHLVISKAARSDELADTISCMFDDESQRRKLISPLFYLRVLFA